MRHKISADFLKRQILRIFPSQTGHWVGVVCFCFTSSITCWPFGSLLIRDWMTWNSGLGSGAAASSTLQNKVNPNLTWHPTKCSNFKAASSYRTTKHVITSDVSSNSDYPDAFDLLTPVVNHPSGDSWPVCPGSWLNWCGRRPPGSWRAERAATGTHRGPETSWGSPGKRRAHTRL